MKGRNSSKISIRLPDKSIELLRELSKTSGLSVNGVVKMLLNKGYMAYKGKSIVSPTTESPDPLPLYNKEVHHAGDRVLIQRGKRLVETVVPHLDMDGQSIT